MMIFFVLTVACTSKTPEANWSGSAWDRCNDTAAGACDTGAEEVVEEEPTNAVPTGDSCTWGHVCVSANEADNQAWCEGLAGTYAADACAEGYDGSCALPAGGDYTAAATAYYYGTTGPEAACTGAGGAYTAA
jgi:hypothetical protein